MESKDFKFPAFELYVSQYAGKSDNVIFPKRVIIDSQESLKTACKKDHTGTKLKNNYRADANFIECGVIMLDFDNDDYCDQKTKKNSDLPKEKWVTSEDLHQQFPGVAFYAVSSRNHGKTKHPGEKNERSARPRFHAYFPIRNPFTDAEKLKKTKKEMLFIVPSIDNNALGATRMFFGHSNPQVKFYPGDMDILEYLKAHPEIKAKTETQQAEIEKQAAIEQQKRIPRNISSDFDDEFIRENIGLILDCISSDCEEGYWSSVAYSLKKDGLPFELFDDWSAKTPGLYNAKYQKTGKTGRDACYLKWKQKKPSDANNLGVGWLYKQALLQDPTLKDRIIKTGRFAKKNPKSKAIQKATTNKDTSNKIGENTQLVTETNNELQVLQAVEQPKPKIPEKEIPPLEIYNADYFNNTEIEAPTPIIDRILYPGLGILGSPAKMGKSYMVLQLCVAVTTGENFLGFTVERPGDVLYLDLQGTKRRTKKRLNNLGYETMPEGLSIAYRARKTDDGFIQQIEQWISSVKNPSLIVVDMVEQIKGNQRRTEDAYRADSRILEPLHDVAIKYNISILGVMHTRKGNAKFTPDDPFNEIIGSVAQFGTADCAWMIIGKRDEDKKRLSIICRDNDDGQEDFEAIFSNHRWSISGTVEEVAEKLAVQEYNNNPVVFTIRALIKESGGGWSGTMSDLTGEVATKTGAFVATPEKMKATVSKLAYRLSCEGIEIEYPNKNGGIKGRRYKFFRKDPEQLQAEI